MKSPEVCAFCDHQSLEERTIANGRHILSIVSRPRFRPGHSLVIPRRHIETLAELNEQESLEMMKEIGRLSLLLDRGFGSGVMQKYQPRQLENGIKVNHLHVHVFPRYSEEDVLFPVPVPNSFEGFHQPTAEEIAHTQASLRPTGDI